MSHLIDRLRDAVGERHVLTDDLDAYQRDWRGAYAGRAACVVRPGSTAEVAAVVRAAADTGAAIVPQGGNTGMSGGAVPDDSGRQVVVSLTRLRAIRDVDPVGDTITVEAGVVLADVQAAAEDAGRLFPVSLAAEGSATVGGNIATNAGGTAVLRYGMMRAQVLGLEVVLPDGRVWDGLRALRKDNTGYDLAQLFVGAEGTLGIVTAAVLALRPPTPARATAWLALRDVAAAADLLGVLRSHAGEWLTTWELVSRPARDLVVGRGVTDPLDADAEWFGLVEIAGPRGADVDGALDRALGDAVEQGLVVDAAVAGSPDQRAGLWALREGVSEAQETLGVSVKHDVSVPIAQVASLVEELGPALQRRLPGVRPVVYGHVGDGNLHYNLSRPEQMASPEFLDHGPGLSEIVHAAVVARHGSISAEHGLGRAKAAAAAAYKPDVEVELMRAVKHALDPRDLMNPGVLLPPSDPTPG